ncbi:MAG: choice-of-anchor J domain-containing protein [Bacteroidales bacterium]|nr:choice-of-anchor J domain-containing protein [Bacteroidales bacterium]
MKRKFTILLMALLALAGFKSWGQTDVEIGTGTQTTSTTPCYCYYNYSYAQMLYLGSEIGKSGTINSISFNVSNNNSSTVNLNIYMKCVDRDSYSSSSDWESVTNEDLVCNTGVVTLGKGWVTFTLDTPFQYDSSKNLMIAVDNNYGHYSSSYATFKYTSTSPKTTCIYQYSDGTNVDPLDPSNGNSCDAYRPNIIINITESGSCPKPKNLAVSNVTATGATISWTGSAESYDLAYGVASTFNLENPSTYTLQNTTTTSVQLSGLTAETEYKCAVRSRCDAESVSDWSDAISFLPTDKIIVDFESGIPSDWTLIDNDGDGRNWFIAQTDHHSGSNSLQSESYSETYYVPYNADNFFVSPQLLLGENASLSFYTRNYNGYSYKDRLRVQISTTGNDAGSFTTTLYDDRPSSSWTEIQIDLSEYEGQNVYIAFRHTDYNMESIYIDDIAIDLGETVEKFAITLTQPEDAAVGTISADYEQAAAGTTVTLSADFNLGYTLNYFMVDGVQIVGNTFEMPEHDVTVSVAYNTLDMYAITFDQSITWTEMSANHESAPEGTEIVLSYTENEAYIFNFWTVNGVQIEGNTFEMPGNDVEVSMNYTVRSRYSVNIGDLENGTITANPSENILGGTEVTLTIEPATGYALTNLTVTEATSGNEVEVTDNTFEMPEDDVNVTATFSAVYYVQIDPQLVGGTITHMSTTPGETAYTAGTYVYFIPNESEDYEYVDQSFVVTTLEHHPGEEPEWVEVTVNVGYSGGLAHIVMPAGNVTVTASFNKVKFAVVQQIVNPIGGGYYNLSKTEHIEKDEWITISYSPEDGYMFNSVSVVCDNAAQTEVPAFPYYGTYTFQMPESDVIVTVNFEEKPYYNVTVGTVTNGTVSVEDATSFWAGVTVWLNVQPLSGDYILESITATPEEGDPITPTHNYSNYYTFTMPSSNVTISATFRLLQSYTINYYVNGELDRTMQCREDGLVNNDGPQNVAVPAGMTFEGWGIAEIDTYVTEKPAVLGNAEYPTQNYNLYAVLRYTEEIPAAKGDDKWVEVTSPSDLNNGDQVIIVKKSSNVVMCDRSSAGSGSFEKATISISNNEITSLPSNAVILTAIDNGGNWKFSFTDAHTGPTTLADYMGGYLLPQNAWGGYDTWTIEQNGSSVALLDPQYNAYASFYSGYFTCVTYTYYKAELFKLYKPTITTNYYMTEVLTNGNIAANTTAKNIIITTGTVTVDNNIVLTMNENGLFRNKDAANFVFGYGAQLITDNTGVIATFKKHINGNDWYTISSPLAAGNTAFADVTNLIPNNNIAAKTYDLYRFDEASGMWINARPVEGQTSNLTTIDKGVGYIYANNAGADHIAFAGEVNVAPAECTLTNGAAHGFNLIGNPFMQNIKLTDVKSDGTAVLADGFYVLNNDETWATEPITTGTIAPLQGFLVQATTAGTATISKPTAAPSKGERSEQNTNIEMIVSNASFKDNAYAMFGEGIGLNKVNHRNAEAPMLYIPQDGEDFAIAFMDENTTVFPLSFKAMTTGSYSIRLKATDDVSTLVLVDNMTGEETNMLLEDSYTFIGSPADNENRFTVKLKISNSQDEDEHFAYQNGSELVVNGEGTLQIFDILGRVVVSEEVHGQTVNVGGLNTGAYIVRLTGESVKTQKIVVR